MPTPQEEGREFEREFAKQIGGVPVKGSGNQWFAKLDVDKSSILFSCKNTRNKSFRLTLEDLHEAIDAVDAPGGRGGGAIGMMAINISGEVFLVSRLSDQMRLFEEEAVLFSKDKNQLRRERSEVPQLLRDLEDD